MSGDDHVAVQVEDPVAGGDPVGDRPVPDDRGAADEEDVAAEHGLGVRQVHQQVTGGMGGAYFQEPDGMSADPEIQFAVEGPVGFGDLDAFEGERTEGIGDVAVGGLTHVGVHEGHEGGWWHGSHLAGCGLGGHDLGAGDQAVAVAVVAVCVRVDERADGPSVGDRSHGVEHGPGELQVEECVDEKGTVVGGEQARIGPAPAAVRLQPCEHTVCHLVEAGRVGSLVRCAHPGDTTCTQLRGWRRPVPEPRQISWRMPLGSVKKGACGRSLPRPCTNHEPEV